MHKSSVKTRVLFLCTGNSCRSQMAEGFLRHMAGDKFEAFSAGVAPIQVNPLSIKAMEEIGVDISRQKSKPVIEFRGQSFDYVITVCDKARQACPVFPGRQERIHWDLPDPAEAKGGEKQKFEAFRKVRNQIREKVEKFIRREAEDKTASINCPQCGHIQPIEIPAGKCLPFYRCQACQELISAPADVCCVICAYADKKCPSSAKSAE